MKLFDFEIEIGSKDNPILVIFINDQNLDAWLVLLGVVVVAIIVSSFIVYF